MLYSLRIKKMRLVTQDMFRWVLIMQLIIIVYRPEYNTANK